MKNFKKLIFSLMTITLLSCSSDDGNSATNTFTFDGETYTIADAYIEDWGLESPLNDGNETHYNYNMGISDVQFTLFEESPVESYFGGSDGVSIVIDIDLYSSGDGSFETGTFVFVNPLTAASGDIENLAFFLGGEIELDDDGLAPNGDLDGDEYWISGGTVTISGTELNYTIDFTLEASDWQTGDPVGTAVGSYSGKFQYADNTNK